MTLDPLLHTLLTLLALSGAPSACPLGASGLIHPAPGIIVTQRAPSPAQQATSFRIWTRPALAHPGTALYTQLVDRHYKT